MPTRGCSAAACLPRPAARKHRDRAVLRAPAPRAPRPHRRPTRRRYTYDQDFPGPSKISSEPRTDRQGGACVPDVPAWCPPCCTAPGEKAQAHRLSRARFAAPSPRWRHHLSPRDQHCTRLCTPKAIHVTPSRTPFEHVDLILVRRGENITVEIAGDPGRRAGRDTLITHGTTPFRWRRRHHARPLEASMRSVALLPVTAGAVTLPRS